MNSAVLPLGCTARPLPLRSPSDLMPESAVATTWKYCGYNVATLHTLTVFCSNGARPARPSTVEMELPKPRSALPWCTALTLAMPAPGSTCTLTPALSAMLAMAPPSGYHDPPCGPVIRSEEHTSELH